MEEQIIVEVQELDEIQVTIQDLDGIVIEIQPVEEDTKRVVKEW